MDPGAVESQIQAYQQAANNLAEVQTTLQNVKNNLAATWTGDAAEQAQQSFQQSINHAQATQETITGTVVPALQNVKSTQTAFIVEGALVPDEKPVPSTNALESGFDWVTGQATPTQLAQAHNIQARNQAAQALNSLSDSYDHSAAQLNNVGGGGTSYTSTSSSSAFNLGPAPSSSGNGAASSDNQRVGGSGYTARTSAASSPSGTISVGSNPRTTLAGTSTGSSSSGSGTITDTPTGGGSGSTATVAPAPVLIGSDPVEAGGGRYGGGGVVSDQPGPEDGKGLGTDPLGDENLSQNRPGTNQGVFDETGFSDGQLTGGTGTGSSSGGSTRGNMSSDDGNSLIEQRTETGGGVLDEGEATETGMAGGMGQGIGAGEGESGASRYSRRGRYFDPVEEDDAASLSPIRSAFEDATDARGNRVNMMTSGRRSLVPDDDEEDARSQRPSYLKEDEFWNSAQRIVPPVIQ